MGNATKHASNGYSLQATDCPRSLDLLHHFLRAVGELSGRFCQPLDAKTLSVDKGSQMVKLESENVPLLFEYSIAVVRVNGVEVESQMW